MEEKTLKATNGSLLPEEQEMKGDAKKMGNNGEVSANRYEEENGDSNPAERKEDSGDLSELSAQLDVLKQKADEERDRLLRVLAEFENYKKRMNRQMEDYKKYANESLLKELLPVVDNLERAITSSSIDAGNSNESCVVEGVEMTLGEILKILEKFHVTQIEAEGKLFDPVFHEAVMQQESDEYPAKTVMNVLQKGYMIYDRLLRPAMVIVSKGKSDIN